MEGVRRAVPEDIPAVMGLLVQVNMVHHRGRPDLFKGPATKYTEEELRTLLEDDRRPVFVYEDADGRVLGHLFCVHQKIEGDSVRTDVETLYIDDLCVDEAVRGRHIGRALYDHAVRYAREQGCYDLTLNVWSCNPTAMRFYEKCGLVPQKVGMELIL